MLYVVITRRVVKHNTGATAKFAPRTSNVETYEVSGPFMGAKAVQQAMVAALATHTCLSAQAYSAAGLPRPSSDSNYQFDQVMKKARALLDGIRSTVEA